LTSGERFDFAHRPERSRGIDSAEGRGIILPARLGILHLWKPTVKDSRCNTKMDMNSNHPTERRADEDRRQSVVDRRLWLDRRRGPGRRLTDERKSAEEGQMSDEQFEFLMAIDEYKRKNTRPFPTWTEVLEVIKALGYRRVAEPQSLTQFGKDAEHDQVCPETPKEQKQARVVK